jgi:hypothetical protein
MGRLHMTALLPLRIVAGALGGIRLVVRRHET